MKIFEHLTQLDNAVGFYRKGIIAILIVCAIFFRSNRIQKIISDYAVRP